MNAFYRTAQVILRGLMKVVFRLEVKGKEHLPEKGPAILCSNHMSVIDPVILGCAVNPQITFMAKKELFDIPVLSFLIKKLGAMPVKRGEADRKAIKLALEKLKGGGVFGLFPEGTRNKEKNKELKPLRGVGFIAARSKVKVIPVTIIGDYIPFKKIQVIAHEPMIYNNDSYKENYEDPILGFTQEIMEVIYKDL